MASRTPAIWILSTSRAVCLRVTCAAVRHYLTAIGIERFESAPRCLVVHVEMLVDESLADAV